MGYKRGLLLMQRWNNRRLMRGMIYGMPPTAGIGGVLATFGLMIVVAFCIASPPLGIALVLIGLLVVGISRTATSLVATITRDVVTRGTQSELVDGAIRKFAAIAAM